MWWYRLINRIDKDCYLDDLKPSFIQLKKFQERKIDYLKIDPRNWVLSDFEKDCLFNLSISQCILSSFKYIQ